LLDKGASTRRLSPAAGKVRTWRDVRCAESAQVMRCQRVAGRGRSRCRRLVVGTVAGVVTAAAVVAVGGGEMRPENDGSGGGGGAMRSEWFERRREDAVDGSVWAWSKKGEHDVSSGQGWPSCFTPSFSVESPHPTSIRRGQTPECQPRSRERRRAEDCDAFDCD